MAVETAAAVARTESGLNPFAIGDNTTGQHHKPASREAAIALATELVVVNRHSVDLGLMQVNSANLARLGLTVSDALDPCRNLAAAERVLVEGYAAPEPGGDQQGALLQTLSRYNTGSPVRGLDRDAGGNGYVSRVQASAEVVVPAIRLRGDDGTVSAAPLRGSAPVLVQPLPPPPASWDVYGQARAARGQGAAIYSPNRAVTPPSTAAPTPPSASAPPVAGPVLLHSDFKQQAANEYR